MMAWIKLGEYDTNIQKGIKFLLGNVSGASYGSTQATVLSLQAIILYQKEFMDVGGSGDFKLYVDSQLI